MPRQFQPFRDLKQNPEPQRVANDSRESQCKRVQINAQQFVQDEPRPLYIVDVQRTDPTRPEHNAEVVVWIFSPERFGLGRINDVLARLVPPPSLRAFLARMYRY